MTMIDCCFVFSDECTGMKDPTGMIGDSCHCCKKPKMGEVPFPTETHPLVVKNGIEELVGKPEALCNVSCETRLFKDGEWKEPLLDVSSARESGQALIILGRELYLAEHKNIFLFSRF